MHCIPFLVHDLQGTMAPPKRSAVSDVVTREVTINIHKRVHATYVVLPYRLLDAYALTRMHGSLSHERDAPATGHGSGTGVPTGGQHRRGARRRDSRHCPRGGRRDSDAAYAYITRYSWLWEWDVGAEWKISPLPKTLAARSPGHAG